MRWFVFCFVSVFAGCAQADDYPWDIAELKKTPDFRWEKDSGPIREIIYSGNDFLGKPTETFAFFASPATIGGFEPEVKGQFPGVVLIHGGGGTAFSEWVHLWAKRGYAAIAMDLSGRRPPSAVLDPETGAFQSDAGFQKGSRKRLEKGGPEHGREQKFDSIGGDISDDWAYHTVANVMRAHSLLRSFPEVDGNRTAVTGISWGGYSTCLVASHDDRFKAAVPVYGCGFLYEGESVQKPAIDELGERRKEWIDRWDPSNHLKQCRVPIFFVNGTHDVHYPLDSYQKSFDVVPGPKFIRIEPRMKHGHKPGWEPKEIGRFIDFYCVPNSKALPVISKMSIEDDRIVTATAKSATGIASAKLHYTTETGKRSARKWQVMDAAYDKATNQLMSTESLPAEANTWFITVTDDQGSLISSVVKFAP